MTKLPMSERDVSTDAEKLYPFRKMLEGLLEIGGVKVTGGGIGMGQADIEAEFNGVIYDISITVTE